MPNQQHERHESHKASDLVTTKKKSKTYPVGRICAEEGCKVVLSRYNRGQYCSTHEGHRDARAESGDERASSPRKGA